MKKLIISMLCVFIPFLFCVNVYAASEYDFSMSSPKTAVSVGETLKLELSYSGNEDIGSFVVTLEYEDGAVDFVKAEKGAAASGDYCETYDDGASTKAIWTYGSDNPLSGQVFTFSYKVKEDYDGDLLNFNVSVTDVVDRQGNSIGGEFTLSKELAIIPEPSNSAELLWLSPSYGQFNEEFSSEVTEYTMDVPYAVRQIQFETEVSEGAKAAVNRKNLGSGGSVNKFIVTVTAADGETKKQYTVFVTRGEYQKEDVVPSEKESYPVLLSLYPSQGKLNEEFDSAVFNYTMSVPYEVKSLEFVAAASEGAEYKVNRKNLGSGGSTTDFIITVAGDGYKGKSIYTVSVTRGEYVRNSLASSDSTGGKSSGSKSQIVSQANDTENYIIDKYTERTPIVVKNNSFNSFVVGGILVVGAMIAAVLVFIAAVKIMSKSGKHKNKHL